MGKVADQFKFIEDKLCGDNDDWFDVIEVFGVRPAFYNGRDRAYVGTLSKNWTNATVAVFHTREECKKWCDDVNDILGPHDILDVD